MSIFATELNKNEVKIINYYRAIKKYLKPGNFTVHFDNNGEIKKRDFHGNISSESYKSDSTLDK